MSEQIDWSKAPEGCIGVFAPKLSIGSIGFRSFFVITKRYSDYGAQAGCSGQDSEGKEYHVFEKYWDYHEKPASWSGEIVDPDNLELKMLADKYLSYSTETGALTWKDNQQKRFIGREAGYVTHHGYRRINLGKVKIHAHQLIWLMVNGLLPSCEIDHINGDRDDNRIENLRLATTQQNQQNAGVRVDNALGIKGVRLRPSGRYQARVSLTDGSRLTKTFKTHVEAVCWLAKQREESHGDFANTTEQIAADERERFAQDLVAAMGKGCGPNALYQARRMYDLGYRKP